MSARQASKWIIRSAAGRHRWGGVSWKRYARTGNRDSLDCLLCDAGPIRDRLRRDLAMAFDDILGLLLTIAGLAYLTYAMLRPEKF
jgi:K+-transporting ATPase KdpF subunit